MRNKKNKILYKILFFITISLVALGCYENEGSGSDSYDKLNNVTLRKTFTELDSLLLLNNNLAWNSDKWDDFRLVIKNYHDENNFLWEIKKSGEKNTRIFKIITDNILENNSSKYSFSSYKNKKVLVLNNQQSSGNSDDLLELAIHEGFHYFIQENWYQNNKSDRSVNYPINWEPRFYRFQIIQNIRNSFLFKDNVYLEKAAYWFRLWKEKYPIEVENLSDNDRIEGSANFVGKYLSNYSLFGLNKSQEDFFEYLRDTDTELPIDFDEKNESYIIGYYCGLLLKDNSDINWENRVENGETFLEILLENIDSLNDSDDAVKEEIKSKYLRKNKLVKEAILPFIENYISKDFFNVVIPQSWSTGSFETNGLINYEYNNEKYYILLDVNGTFESLSGNELLLKGINVENSGVNGVNKYSIVVPIARENVFEDLNNNITVLQENFLLKNQEYTKVQSEPGKTWIYLK